MKIVHILNHVKNAGNGIVCATIDLACEQAKQGHKVYVISEGGDFVEFLQQHGIEHFEVNQNRKPLTILKALYACHKVFKHIRPDIVHAQMMTGVVMAKALKFFHSYKLISTVHNVWQKSANFMGLADVVIIVSDEVKRTMSQRGMLPTKMRVVKNGTLGSVRDRLLPDETLELQRPSITTVAGLYQRKGISTLIKAFGLIVEKIPQAHLYIVGEGPNRAEFETLAAQSSHPGSIHFEGFQKNPKKYLKSTDVFVLASYEETFGLVVSEAREAGCAIVASDTGGIPEVLDGGSAGQLFPVADHVALAQKVIALLQDPAALNLWREKAASNTQWLSVERVAAETDAVYKAALKSNG